MSLKISRAASRSPLSCAVCACRRRVSGWSGERRSASAWRARRRARRRRRLRPAPARRPRGRARDCAAASRSRCARAPRRSPARTREVPSRRARTTIAPMTARREVDGVDGVADRERHLARLVAERVEAERERKEDDDDARGTSASAAYLPRQPRTARRHAPGPRARRPPRALPRPSPRPTSAP